MLPILLFLAACFLACSNGANDNFKGVASLYGSGTTSYRAAIGWATLTTFAGSVASVFLAATLLKKFTGKGLVPDALAGSEYFVLAVAAGAGLTVILATRTGFPISTTHALMGAMAGSGWMAAGGAVNLSALGKSFVLPLLLSPVVAVAVGGTLYLTARWMRLRLGITKEWCFCVGEVQPVPVPQPASVMCFPTASPIFSAGVGEGTECEQRYAGRYLGVSCQRAMDAAHFLSAGVVSFARGLNDTPKMAALLLILPAVGVHGSLLTVGVAIAAGGMLGARRVAETMSHKITGMNHGQGFSANLATGALVISASMWGLPVSTTHVSVGSLLGIGITTRQTKWHTVIPVLLSWFVTLPCAALAGAAVLWLVSPVK